jgi:cyanophycinase-like exopeptidase
MKKLYSIILFLITQAAMGQTYTSYFTGDTSDVNPTPLGGTVLMGGASENDSAMVWFLKQANGGDIVVIRATGSNGYNNYLYTDLGVPVNSVETIVMPSLQAAQDPYVEDKIRKAEGLWIAGGDQFNYVSFWKNQPVEDAINYLINVKKAVIGGTSAGMAIQGQAYFDAANGTVSSAAALANPYAVQVSIGYNDFLSNNVLQNVITDTHYNNPDRKGRHLVFLARMMQDFGIDAKGIACNEYVSVCIDSNNIARVYGEYPTYPDEFAFFIQVNCVLPNTPEQCASGIPLTWQRNNEALKVYKVAGTMTGSNTFDLNDWVSGIGGNWENWYVNNGAFNTMAGSQPNCNPTTIKNNSSQKLSITPNPASHYTRLYSSTIISSCIVYAADGRVVLNQKANRPDKEMMLYTEQLTSGIYFIQITDISGKYFTEKLIVD